MKETIINLLKETSRTGIIELIDAMEEGGFFEAPCSSDKHLCREGGLAEHSLNVVYKMMEIDKAFKADLPWDSVILCGLLHDLGKMGDHGKANYVPNVLKSGTVSAAKPFITNKELLYIPHEIRSVAIAERYIELSEKEEFAILYHNALYSDLKYSYAGKETPLSMILHFSDLWVSRVTEVKDGNMEDD